jgi:hypothetical protein
MNAGSLPIEESGMSPATIGFIVILVLVLAYVAYYFYTSGPTTPPPSYKSGFLDASGNADASGNTASDAGKKSGEVPKVKVPGTGLQVPGVQVQLNLNTAQPSKQEGFFGGVARGSGAPDCLRSSAEGAELIGMFQGGSEEGKGDLRELTQIVSKLSCFKKDLVSPSHTVEATRYQQFVTSHDIEPIAETTGRCFSKTIPPRDLELAFDKWAERGDSLLRRLCSAYGFSSAKYDKAVKLYSYVLRDVKDIARGACLQGEPSIAGKPGPRDPHPFEDPSYAELGTYTGYY